MGYSGKWKSIDQIPQRAVDEGLIDRLGTIDPSDGGRTYRYSLSGDYQKQLAGGLLQTTAYAIRYYLKLYSNFTYYLDDPVNGDQFHQTDHRFVSGVKLSHRRFDRWAGRLMQNTVGVQVRSDDIGTVGLYHTRARQLLDTVRQDAVLQTSIGGYLQNEIAWTPWLRTLGGLRVDGYRFRIDASDPAKGGIDRTGIVSPKRQRHRLLLHVTVAGRAA